MKKILVILITFSSISAFACRYQNFSTIYISTVLDQVANDTTAEVVTIVKNTDLTYEIFFKNGSSAEYKVEFDYSSGNSCPYLSATKL